jgi:signal-transduction protein with cAMP-binding, CBS, and nucleotidyltransferase domain
MSDILNTFNDFVNKFAVLSKHELQDLNSKCEIVNFVKGDVIIKAHAPQNSMFFIVKGLIRNYLDLENGSIKIYNFRMENSTVTGYALYNYTNSFKARLNVECLEDCIMVKVPLDAINYVIANYKNGERLGRFLAEYHVMEMINYVIERDTMTILDRYENMEKGFPNLHQRVPQHMIASYLGITPVHLSNIKKSRKK